MEEETLDKLKQVKRRKELADAGTGPWTIVYENWYSQDDTNGGWFAAFTMPRHRKQVMASSSWDLTIGGGKPGFTQYWDSGKSRQTYLRFGNTDGVEPLVISQTHYDVRPRMLPQLSEEFRLYHNLWVSADGKQLYKIKDDGTDELVAEISPDLVRVRTYLLRQFQAGRRRDLVLLLDSVQYVNNPDKSGDLDALTEEYADADLVYSFHAGDFISGKQHPFSRLLGKKLLNPPPISRAGIWPFDERHETYPNFIIGEDATGELITFTCEEKMLANYFGSNPNSPHYLTPVFFRREVLQKYYDDPDRYSVEDGYLRCGGMWGVRIDNDHPDHVMVFLGDLGRDLPESERGYWRSFNIPPSGHMSGTNFKRSFLGEFADAQAPDLRFKSMYGRFNKQFRQTQGWYLFKPLHDADQHVLKQLHIPLKQGQAEFEDQLRNLTKLVVDSLNEKELVKQLGSKIDGEKGIAKLERWFKQIDYPHRERDLEYLRRLQTLRSKLAAHRKGSDYTKVLAEAEVDTNTTAEIARMLWAGCRMLNDLALHLDIKLGP